MLLCLYFVAHKGKQLDLVRMLCVTRVFPGGVININVDSSPSGVFLYESLTLVQRWRSSKEIYSKECGSVRGFSTDSTFDEPQDKRLSYEDFLLCHYRWHMSMASVCTEE